MREMEGRETERERGERERERHTERGGEREGGVGRQLTTSFLSMTGSSGKHLVLQLKTSW